MIKTVLRILLIFVFASLLTTSVLSSSNITLGSSKDKVADTNNLQTAANWFSGWTYRKAHNITGSTAGVQTNYPMMINVHYDYGFDTEGDVYLNHECRIDFGDIRFTDPSGANLLSYWIQQKTDGVQALFWVKFPYVPRYPDHTTIYIYYGNSTASTTSNKQLVFSFATDFEDGTKQGWIISWSTYTSYDGVSTQAFQGNYARMADRSRGSNYAGNGEFYEGFMNSAYLSAGTYRLTCWARFSLEDSYQTPVGIILATNGNAVDNVTTPHTTWQLLDGNFTVNAGATIQLFVEFHLRTTNLGQGGNPYFLDDVILRKWCNPEPTHGIWGAEQISGGISPQIYSVLWSPTCPAPYVASSVPRQGEPVLVEANVSEQVGGSGFAIVELLFRANTDPWCNVSMVLNQLMNATSGLWTAKIPGQLGNTIIEFQIKAYDNAGNTATSLVYSFTVKALIQGDINGDGIVSTADLHILGVNWGKTS